MWRAVKQVHLFCDQSSIIWSKVNFFSSFPLITWIKYFVVIHWVLVLPRIRDELWSSPAPKKGFAWVRPCGRTAPVLAPPALELLTSLQQWENGTKIVTANMACRSAFLEFCRPDYAIKISSCKWLGSLKRDLSELCLCSCLEASSCTTLLHCSTRINGCVVLWFPHFYRISKYFCLIFFSTQYFKKYWVKR